MDAFVTRARSTSPKAKAGVKTSAEERKRQFCKETHVSGGLLFCSTCNVVLDHQRKSTVDNHMQSEKHKKRKATSEKLQQPAKRQCVIAQPPTVAAEARNEICQEWVAMCAAANIPLSKTDHPAVRDFLQKRVVNGGAIPGSHQLRDCYLEREYLEQKEALKETLGDQPLAIMTDEMSDDNGRYVLNILAAPLRLTDGVIKSYLLDTVFLEATNHSTVSQAVVSTVIAYGLDMNNVAVVNTDNASYMKKAYRQVFKNLFPNSVHITCMAHIMNLLGDSFKKPFKDVNRFVKCMSAMFFKAGARKFRFLKYLKEVNPEKTAKMPPNPVSTRWNCWYLAVAYHAEHFQWYGRFISDEIEMAKSQAPESLQQLKEVFACSRKSNMLLQQLKFIIEKSAIFVTATDIFQSQSPLILKAWPMLQDLQCRFDGGLSQKEVSKFFLEDFTQQDKMELIDLCSQAYALTAAKLDVYLGEEGQPGINFLKEVQFFNPAKLLFIPPVEELLTLQKLHSVPTEEVDRYMKQLGPQAVQNNPTSSIDVNLFWSSVAEEVPTLAACAKWYIFSTVNSADAERSFSVYNLIMTDRRRSLGQASLRSLAFLAYNQFAGKDFFN